MVGICVLAKLSSIFSYALMFWLDIIWFFRSRSSGTLSLGTSMCVGNSQLRNVQVYSFLHPGVQMMQVLPVNGLGWKDEGSSAH